MRRSRRLRSGSVRSGPGRQSASVEPGKRSIRNAPKERKINGRKELQRAADRAKFERWERRDALGALLEYYDQPTDKAREAAEWFDIDEGGSCWEGPCSVYVGGIRRAAEFLKALADILEGRGLSQEPVYDDVDAVDEDDDSKSEARSS
jgi:hypothetical protein